MQELRDWYEQIYERMVEKRSARRSETHMNVFITGGSQGIGLAIAKEYLRRGSRVAIFARNRERLDEAEAVLTSIAPGRVASYCMDVTDEADVQAVTARAATELGAPDVLVNCAGIIAGDRFENIPSEKFEAVLRTNVLGAVHTVRALLASLKGTRGQIVNIASVAGIIGVYGYTAYSGSKYALIGFSESLRAELHGEGISVTVVCPPEVPTAMVEEEDKTLPRAAKILKQMAGVISLETVARATVNGANRGQFMVIPGMMAKAVCLSHALSLGHLSRVTSDLVTSLIKE